jgi:hypothetical protein
MKPEDKQYNKPEIVDHGELTDVTAAHTVGHTFDGNFTLGQPIPPNISSLP